MQGFGEVTTRLAPIFDDSVAQGAAALPFELSWAVDEAIVAATWYLASLGRLAVSYLDEESILVTACLCLDKDAGF